MKIVNKRMQMKLLGEKSYRLINERKSRRRSVSSAIAKLDTQIDLLDVHCDIQKTVLLNPFNEVIGLRR